MTERTIRTHQLKIKAAWQKAVSSIIETGQLLTEAKAALEHGEWGKLFEGDDKLPFGQEAARQLMKVASHPVLSNSQYTGNLPPSWYSLFTLTQLPQQQLERHIAEGDITAETTQEEAIALVRPRPAAVTPTRSTPTTPTVEEEFERDFDRLLKLTEIDRWCTLVLPWDYPGYENLLEGYFEKRRFLRPGSIAEEFERAASILSQTAQLVRRAESKVRNAAVATNGSDAPLVRTLEADEAISVTSGIDRGTVGEQLSETEARQILAVEDGGPPDLSCSEPSQGSD